MKNQKVIDSYCRMYGAKLPKVNIQEVQYFVIISIGKADILYLRKSSKLLGQIIGASLKHCVVLYISHNKMIQVTWDNWKLIWNTLFAPKIRKHDPEPNNLRPYKSKIFEDAQKQDLYIKPHKCGFNCSFEANKSMA